MTGDELVQRKSSPVHGSIRMCEREGVSIDIRSCNWIALLFQPMFFFCKQDAISNGKNKLDSYKALRTQ
jgi:hypothetical protein